MIRNMGTNKIDANILATPEIQRAIRGGVISALTGSGWAFNSDQIDEQVSEITLLLVDGYLDRYDASRGKGLPGFVRMVAHKKTVSYIKLHVHKYDGAMNRGSVNHTDFTSEDDTAPRGVYADESADLGFVRVEQRERLERALDALTADERSHFEALIAGQTSAEWAESHGYTPVQATRQKKALVAKLAALVQADE